MYELEKFGFHSELITSSFGKQIKHPVPESGNLAKLDYPDLWDAQASLKEESKQMNIRGKKTKHKTNS